MAKEIERLSLLDISPPSITGDENVQHLITSIDPELWNVSQSIREAFIISRLDELPEEVLDLLAWQWHVDFYELAHSVEAKREMVKKSIVWHKKKGTRGAILDALAMLGVEARFTSWHESGADPYTFAIDAKLTGEFWERVDWSQPAQTVRRAIIQSKAARSWISRLYIYQEAETEQALTVGTATGQAYHHDIAQLQPEHSPSIQLITAGTGILHRPQHEVGIIWSTGCSLDLGIQAAHGVAQGGHHEIDTAHIPRCSEIQALSIAGTVQQKPVYEIEINQAHSSKLDARIASAGIVACGVHTQIIMAA